MTHVLKYGSISLLCTLLLLSLPLHAQSPWAVGVLDHQFGVSQTMGQGTEYFPENVLGPITAPVGPTVPASTPTQIVSLGRGGWVSLIFDPPIIDGPGPDFTVFENAFYYGVDNSLVYDEWMTVSVSADGQTWYDFAADCSTGVGMAGRTPTAAYGVDYGKPEESGGDSFDLADLPAGAPDTVRYVRVTDATHCQPADRLGAELDAIRAINQVQWPTARQQVRAASPLRQLANGHILAQEPLAALVLYNSLGQPVARRAALAATQQWQLPTTLPSGAYVLQAQRPRHPDKPVRQSIRLVQGAARF